MWLPSGCTSWRTCGHHERQERGIQGPHVGGLAGEEVVQQEVGGVEDAEQGGPPQGEAGQVAAHRVGKCLGGKRRGGASLLWCTEVGAVVREVVVVAVTVVALAVASVIVLAVK